MLEDKLAILIHVDYAFIVISLMVEGVGENKGVIKGVCEAMDCFFYCSLEDYFMLYGV